MRLFQWIAQVMGVMIVVYDDERTTFQFAKCCSTGQSFVDIQTFPHAAAQAVNKWSSSKLFAPYEEATYRQRVILTVYRTMAKVAREADHMAFPDNGLEKLVIKALLKWSSNPLCHGDKASLTTDTVTAFLHQHFFSPSAVTHNHVMDCSREKFLQVQTWYSKSAVDGPIAVQWTGFPSMLMLNEDSKVVVKPAEAGNNHFQLLCCRTIDSGGIDLSAGAKFFPHDENVSDYWREGPPEYVPSQRHASSSGAAQGPLSSTTAGPKRSASSSTCPVDKKAKLSTQ
jgi:hypothetical protein